MRVGAGTITEFVGLGNALACDKPETGELAVLVATLSEGKQADLDYPTNTGTDTPLMKASHGQFCNKLRTLSRLVHSQRDTALQREISAAGAGASVAPGAAMAAEGEAVKRRRSNCRVEILQHVQDTNLVYQSGITLAASDPSTVLETRLDFERNRLQVVLLNSGKYSRGMTTFKPEPVLKAASDGTVRQETPDVPVNFTKNSSVQA